MTIEFRTDIGKIIFSGGRSYGRDTCYIAEVTGLGLAPVVTSTAVFSGMDGTATVSKRYDRRNIVLSADIPYRKYDFEEFYGRILRIISKSGELIISSGRKKRRICAYVSQNSEGKNKGDTKRLILTFTCDDPYFTDIQKTTVPIMTKKRYLATEFTLPCIFSSRLNTATVTNSGDIVAEPIISFANAFDGAYAEDGDLVIKNETTGQFIVLNYYPSPGETVYIDIENRTIMSSSSANLLNRISDDTDLSDFCLAVGNNTIKVESNVTNNKVYVGCSYYNRYIEGIVYGY